LSGVIHKGANFRFLTAKLNTLVVENIKRPFGVKRDFWLCLFVFMLPSAFIVIDEMKIVNIFREKMFNALATCRYSLPNHIGTQTLLGQTAPVGGSFAKFCPGCGRD
jgi:hypothetical protein